ncbi:hypothetical protein JIG36_12190 [Actinoplanes sp. LDG1-06]|uniref:Uncharacterized protein n=1 Tax=Paractinoplanes ovalisporus TaxID=2810368 RepID=A0ABS2A905_9ACTN|nr:hypothetical protein [Actinoplanes ovalisporus]MBM2616316.1 hypothetical protein [Actinoplanes ovalisporus]
MSLNAVQQRETPGAQRTGYAVAAVVNGALLLLVNWWPGWQAVPFLTVETERVLTLVNLSLLAGVVANLLYLLRPASWVVPAGGLVTTGIGLVVLVRMWQVFPFDLGAGSWWNVVVRVLLVVAMAGSVIALPVQLVSLAGRLRLR